MSLSPAEDCLRQDFLAPTLAIETVAHVTRGTSSASLLNGVRMSAAVSMKVLRQEKNHWYAQSLSGSFGTAITRRTT